MELSIIESLCIVNTGWKTKEEKELFDIAYDVIKKESKILHLQYQKLKFENEIKVINETFKSE